MASSACTRALSMLGASTSRQGLPGIMPADFAAMSIAPETFKRHKCFAEFKMKCINSFYSLVLNLLDR